MKPLGSKTLGTSEIRLDEGLLYIQAAMENGADLETANDDMHMIDNLFAIKRFHFVTHGYLKTTWRGNVRKNQTLSDALESVIDNRVKEQLGYEM